MRASPDGLSPWWRYSLAITMICGLAVLIWLAVRTYQFAPPIPDSVIGPGGITIMTADDIRAGQEVFLKYGLMENGSVWGHGAYLGPDFSAEYLHALAVAAGPALKQNHYDPHTGTLIFTEAEAATFEKQVARWTAYFAEPTGSVGLPTKYITDPAELRHLTAFFAWTAWASVANRPGKSYSYTNNFPYEPLAGNTLTADAILWSALSLITLLAGTAGVLFAFGKFDFLGWKGRDGHVHPMMLPGVASDSQRATIKLFAIVSLLFVAQVIGGAAGQPGGARAGSGYQPVVCRAGGGGRRQLVRRVAGGESGVRLAVVLAWASRLGVSGSGAGMAGSAGWRFDIVASVVDSRHGAGTREPEAAPGRVPVSVCGSYDPALLPAGDVLRQRHSPVGGGQLAVLDRPPLGRRIPGVICNGDGGADLPAIGRHVPHERCAGRIGRAHV